MAKRKRCMTLSKHLEGGFSRCDNKIKPGTPFCNEHFETHVLVEVKCNGAAHRYPMDYDHCMVCLPFWGVCPIAVLKSEPNVVLWTRGTWE
jgi:hypothetical protein